MNVKELREALEGMQDHWPVHVSMPTDGSGGGADVDYLYTLDCVQDNYPSQGSMAVIIIDTEPT